MLFADIIIDISHEKVDRPFQYRVPEELEDRIRIGMVVEIPFGNGNHLRRGYCIGLSKEAGYEPEKIKNVIRLCSDEETIESRLILLAGWMKEQYGSTMIQALKTVLPMREKLREKENRFLSLNIPAENAKKLAARWETGRKKARARLLRSLAEKGELDYTAAGKELKITPAMVKALAEEGILCIRSRSVYRMPAELKNLPPEMEKPLTADQQQAVAEIRREWERENPRPVLLFGVTGSGKTQVYLKLIEEILAEGKQAIVLIPEIALTYQTIRRFYGRFGEKVSVLNSRLSPGERYDQFRRAKNGEIQVMVGPRSALFTPFPRLGLIVVDEEHEQTYKSENTPRYHARETAVYRAGLEGARVLFGSATPSLEAYSRAKSGEYGFARLGSRFEERPLPAVSVVDLRKELAAGNRSVFSRRLQEAIEDRLDRGEQTMLFLNRRGYAGFVACRSCGFVMKCPHCDVSLAEHSGGRLVCHYCGYEHAALQACPECGSLYFGGFRAGTQQIEQAVKRMFPKASVLRMDFDSTRKKGSYEEILSAFAAHQADILVGTQMIVKGHDFPSVTLVGVLAADMSLNASDYRCGERTFQLLTQAVGRSGRGRSAGEAIIQTYHPDHYCIQAAAAQDYERFYEEEMSYRMLLNYPPAAGMLAVLASCEEEELLIRAMDFIEKFVRRIWPGEDLHLIGPARMAIGKINDIYRRILYLKHPDPRVLIRIRGHLEKYIEINSGFRKLYIQYDMNS